MELTKERVGEVACEPGQKDRLVFDDALPDLALRITAGGRKFFLAQYTIGGQRRRVPIGQWGAVTLKAARLAARGILGNVAKGQDVAQVRTAARKAKAAMAGRTLAYARAWYTWATKRGLVASNPFLAFPIGSGTVSRDRVLTAAEVALVWEAAGATAYPFGPCSRSCC